MKKNLKKYINRTILMMIAVVFAAAGTACSNVKIADPLKNEDLVMVVNEVCSVPEGVFYLMEVKDSYPADDDAIFWNRNVGDITMEQYIKDSVKDQLIKMTSSVLMADAMAIYITDEEQTQIDAQASAAYTEISQKHRTSDYGITVDSVRDLYIKKALYNKLFDKLAENVNISISEADTKVIEINYVEIPVSVSINKAEELRSEIKSGTDFETACKAAGYEPVMDKVLKKGEMPEAFENVAYALLDGELSEIIETADCLYIIQCKEDYLVTESSANHDKVIRDARQAAFDDYYRDFAADADMRFNEDIWEKLSVPEL